MFQQAMFNCRRLIPLHYIPKKYTFVVGYIPFKSIKKYMNALNL